MGNRFKILKEQHFYLNRINVYIGWHWQLVSLAATILSETLSQAHRKSRGRSGRKGAASALSLTPLSTSVLSLKQLEENGQMPRTQALGSKRNKVRRGSDVWKLEIV